MTSTNVWTLHQSSLTQIWPPLFKLIISVKLSVMIQGLARQLAYRTSFVLKELGRDMLSSLLCRKLPLFVKSPALDDASSENSYGSCVGTWGDGGVSRSTPRILADKWADAEVWLDELYEGFASILLSRFGLFTGCSNLKNYEKSAINLLDTEQKPLLCLEYVWKLFLDDNTL